MQALTAIYASRDTMHGTRMLLSLQANKHIKFNMCGSARDAESGTAALMSPAQESGLRGNPGVPQLGFGALVHLVSLHLGLEMVRLVLIVMTSHTNANVHATAVLMTTHVTVNHVLHWKCLCKGQTSKSSRRTQMHVVAIPGGRLRASVLLGGRVQVPFTSWR